MLGLNNKSLVTLCVLGVAAVAIHLVFREGSVSKPSPPAYVPPPVAAPPTRPILEYRAECTQRIVEKYEFAADFAFFPGERCSTQFVYPTGACAVFKTNENSPVQGPYGDCTGSLSPKIPTDAALARSIGTPFSVRLTVDQPVSSR